MAISAAVSVAAFSVVLAETFAAVGLSSLIPAGFITLARTAKQLAGPDPEITDQDAANLNAALKHISKPDTANSSLAPGAAAGQLIQTLAKGIDDLDVLLPKTAKIHAEFEFHGSERYSYDVAAGCAVEMVTVKAGYSAMYEASSSNRVTLDVEFQSVHVEL